MNTKNSKKIVSTAVFAAIMVLVVTMLTSISPVGAVCNSGSVNVAFVSDPHGGGGGTLPGTNNPAFAGFTFTNEPIANVNAATLANYDTVVMTVCDPESRFSPSQLSDIVNWTGDGGKLIIYDSECASGGATLSYTWLPCKFTAFYPGAWGATQVGYPWVNLTIVEDNTLSSNNPASPCFINTTMIARDTDAAGDQNVFIANDTCWCGDMIGTNVLNDTGDPAAPGTTGYCHAYHHYEKGLIIYNGLDIDYLSANSDPTAVTGVGYLAKIWLCELNQTWDNVDGKDICGLPCDEPIPTEQNPLWHDIEDELDALIGDVGATTMPNIIKQRLLDKLVYAKALRDNAKIVCHEDNFDYATKKLGVAKNQVESFASMVKITRRISAAAKASFLADAASIIAKIDALIEYIETEQRC